MTTPPTPFLTPPQRIRLSRLRDMGWSLWDPFGLMPAGKSWDDERNRHFADEYHTHLLHVAGQLRGGATEADIVAYLIQTESQYMALGERPDTEKRARAVVQAIQAAIDLWTFAD